MMHGRGKSDAAIVAGKPTNKAERSAAEPVEPRAVAKGNANQQSTRRAQSRASVSQALERIRQAARDRKKEKFTALFHHLSTDLLDQAFFDTVSKEWLVRFLEHRIGDRRMLHLIQKWLKMGVLEDGEVRVSDRGTAQGAVISPLLANIYLHYALDLWAERWRRHEATGDMIIVRYADDFIVGFEHEGDARRFLDAMRERLREFSLSLHPDKTRLIEFGRCAAANREWRGLGKPETFNFLGFTFICGKSRRGRFLSKRKTRRDRMRTKLEDIKKVLRRGMHQPIPQQGKCLG